jgi:hypothetical protein
MKGKHVYLPGYVLERLETFQKTSTENKLSLQALCIALLETSLQQIEEAQTSWDGQEFDLVIDPTLPENELFITLGDGTTRKLTIKPVGDEIFAQDIESGLQFRLFIDERSSSYKLEPCADIPSDLTDPSSTSKTG